MEMTEDEFRLVFREFYPGMAYYAAHLVDDDDVKDIVQEAFVELWKRRESMSDADHMKAFLYKTVYTRALNLMKHRAVVKGYSEAHKDLEARRMDFYRPELNDVMRHVESKELRGQIEAAISELPDKRRQAFVMSYLHGMKNKEISEVMDVSVRTVDVHIYKALLYLRDRLAFLKRE